MPIVRTLDLTFQKVPDPTPTPTPDDAGPHFISGKLIFGSNPNAPDGYGTIIAKIDDESIGAGTVTVGNYTITADPGTVEYIVKDMIFHIKYTLFYMKCTNGHPKNIDCRSAR